MKLDAKSLFLRAVALVVLIVIVQQTSASLQASGAWQRRSRTARVRTEDPYSRLDGLIAAAKTPLEPDRLRNPFLYGAPRGGTAVTPRPKPVNTTPQPVPEPPKPTLTAIVWDSDPQATIRYDGRDFSVHSNSLFSEFRVKSISATQVVLDRNGESIVLTLRQGDQ